MCKRLTSMINYFEILGITSTATATEVKKAWIQRCREYHPDKVAHLGEELQQLAATKTLLVNEAYDILKDTERRDHYLYQQSQAQLEQKAPRRRRGDSTPLTLTQFLEAPLKFLEIMREITPIREIPSSLHLTLDSLHFTLMPSKDSSWVLFSKHPQAFKETHALLPKWSHEWNVELSSGMSLIPGDNLTERAQALSQLIQFFPSHSVQMYLNPGERRGPVYEPNTILLSCLNDCSIPSAQDQWLNLGMNLSKSWNQLEMRSNWDQRLERLLPQLFSAIRARSPHRSEGASVREMPVFR